MFEFLNGLLFAVIIAIAGVSLLGLTMPLWSGTCYKISQWIKLRNKRLRDYEDLHSSAGLISPLVDGLLDSELYWKIQRRAWDYEEIDDRLLVINKLSRKLEEQITDRYNTPGMQNVYNRACKTLLNYRRDRAYYKFDAEFDDMYEKAMEVFKDNCLECGDEGGTWEPRGAALQSFKTCNCKKKKRVA